MGDVLPALGKHYIKRLIFNPYTLLWPVVTALSLWVISHFSSHPPLTGTAWVLWSLDSGMVGAYILLPLVVRSTPLGIFTYRGEDFLIGRTERYGLDALCGLLLTTLVLLVFSTLAVGVTAWQAGITVGARDLVRGLVIGTLPTLILMISLVMVLLVLLPSMTSMYLLYLLLGAAFCLLPGFAPWGILNLNQVSTYSLTAPLVLLNRGFCLLGAFLLFRMQVLLVESLTNGQIRSFNQRRQAVRTEKAVVIVGGKGLVLGMSPLTARLRRELLVAGYGRIILGLVLAVLMVEVARWNAKIAHMALGWAWLALAPVLSARESRDRLLPHRVRSSWVFIIGRLGVWLMFSLLTVGVFYLLAPTDKNPIMLALLVVGGMEWLSMVFMNGIQARVFACVFWTVINLVPGALAMTTSQVAWPLVGAGMLMISLVFYQRHPG